eukprot:15364357-Ditylum_brightwellii.AAC.1
MADMDLIDWPNMGAVYDWQKPSTKSQLTKFMHNWLNIGYQKQKFYKDVVSNCPVCTTIHKTWQH